MSSEGKYRKKPVTIFAAQWWEMGDHPAVAAYRGDKWEAAITGSGPKGCEHDGLHYAKHGWISTLEGGHIVCPGDWIITGVKGEQYPCKADIFAMTYEPAHD